MTILADFDLLALGPRLIKDFDPSFVNPASIDIRIGMTAKVESSHGYWKDVDLRAGHTFDPGDFALVSTLEHFDVPNGYAMDLRLKSSTARRGFDHSLAFWVDPNWSGVLTMEIRNVLQFNRLRIATGDRFAQVIVHRLSGPSIKPYQGKYHGAGTVEGAKD